MIKHVLVPQERLAVIIGKSGSVRKSLQRHTNTVISAAERVIVAIGRGFSPENAFDLLDENIHLEIIDLPKDRKLLNRVRSRLIGTKGKIRKRLEHSTDTHISIYGKTAAIIGTFDDVVLCRETIEALIEGAEHSSVFAHLVNTRDKSQ